MSHVCKVQIFLKFDKGSSCKKFLLVEREILIFLSDQSFAQPGKYVKLGLCLTITEWRLFQQCHTVLYLTTISHCMVHVCAYLQVSVTVDSTTETLPCGSHNQVNEVISSQQPPINKEENGKR